MSNPPALALSWEWIFGFNLFYTAFFPIVFESIRQRRSKILFFVLSLVLPFLFASSFWLATRRGDLEFYLQVLALHFVLSALNLFLLWNLVGPKFRVLKMYGCLIVSGLVSLSGIALTAHLPFVDPFWGVFPGTISLDPIISLSPYFLRAWLCLIAALVIVRWRSVSIYFISLWAASAMVGLFVPSTFLFRSALERQFKERATVGPITVFVQDPSVEEFPAQFWAEEFSKHLENILRRLPSSVQPNKNLNFSIFIYKNDDAKNEWIGARQVQIGHFIRGEMHLSHQTPLSPILAHELVHLVHGQSSAPLKSYIDPFFLEGFAVAVSALTLDEAIQKAAAVAQALPPERKLLWPNFLRFYKNFPPKASYALAGGFAAMALKEGKAPWEMKKIDPAVLLDLKVSKEQMDEAREIFSQPPLLEDPLRRDCARLEHNYRLKPSEKNLKKLSTICPNVKVDLAKPLYPRPFESLKNYWSNQKGPLANRMKSLISTYSKSLRPKLGSDPKGAIPPRK